MAKRRLFPFILCLLFLSSSFGSIFLSPPAVLADHEVLLWSTVRTPSDDGFFVVPPSEVSVLVVGSSTQWYAADISNEKLYSTVDGGLTWKDDLLQALLDADPAPVLPVWDIAVAPDDPEFVVVVTGNSDGARQEVYVSEDAGETWDCAFLASTTGWDATVQVSDIAVSALYDSGVRDIAVCTRNPADTLVAGDVWVTQAALLSAWTAQDVNAGAGMDVSCVAFSPDYTWDETIVCVASDSDDTYLWTGYRDTDANSTLWNVTTPDYFEICELDEDSPGESELRYCEMVLPSDYSGDSASGRQVYVTYVSDTEYDDVYWVDDHDVNRLNVARGTDIELASVAYFEGTLMVGEVAADTVPGRASIWICAEPEANFPQWYEPEKAPSGGYGTGVANAHVAFTPDGTWAICATSSNEVVTPADWADESKWVGNGAGNPDESAVSRSDAGYSYFYWNQISLIDTDIRNLRDYSLWIVGDLDEDDEGNVVYLASSGSGLDSIWRTRAALVDDLGQRWERVDYTRESGHDDIIMRRTPVDSPDDAIFYAIRDTNYAYKSLDEGRSWDRVQDCPNITDLAVVDSERIYVLNDYYLNVAQWTKIRRWYVWEWTRDIDTGLESGYSLAYRGDNFIFVGDNGDKGEIAQSTDGGTTFVVLEALPEPGPVHMALDNDFARNKFLYAATEDSGSALYRRTVGESTEWGSLNPPDSGFTGLVHTAGVLYSAFGEGVDRTLVPRADTVLTIDWDRLTVGLSPGVDFRADTLRSTELDGVELWSIDQRDYNYDAEQGCLWVFWDTFARPTPWPTSPAIGEVLECNSCGCDACPFCFEWRELPKAEIYELWVAMDEEFSHVLLRIEGIDPVCCDAPGICYFEIPYSFGCGETYYWRVRATGTTEGEAVHTRWSPSMHFIVAAGTTVQGMHIAPKIDAPEPGAQGIGRTAGFSWLGFPPTTLYEFVLAEDSAFESVVIREELDRTASVYPGVLEWGKTYFWRVRALEPAPSEWAIASFTVIAAPQETPPAAPSPLAGLSSAGMPSQTTSVWVWLVIGLLLLLNVLIIVWIVASRRLDSSR